MRLFGITTATILFLLMVGTTSAQSLYWAKSQISKGNYVEGAKELHPLADGGNAEAQYLAATLFLEGKGVSKNEAQALKYAKLSAAQGYEDGVLLLYKIYKERNDNANAFNTLKQATDAHPYLLKEEIGRQLAVCYIEGSGTRKDAERAWAIMENNEHLDEFKASYAAEEKVHLRVKYGPTRTYTNIRYKNYKNEPDFEPVKVVMDGDKMIVTWKYTYKTKATWITVNDGYILCQGKRYPLLDSSIYRRRLPVKPGDVKYYTCTYPRLPDSATSYQETDNSGYSVAAEVIFR